MEDKIKFIEEICDIKLYLYQKDVLKAYYKDSLAYGEKYKYKIHRNPSSNDMHRFKKLVNLDDWAAGSNGKGLIVEGRVSCITSRGINIDYQRSTLFVKWKNVYYIEKNR